MKKRILASLLALCLVLTPLMETAEAGIIDSDVPYEVEGGSIYFRFHREGDFYSLSGSDSIVVEANIPSVINDKPVTIIGESAFSGNDNLISVIIPDSVWGISQGAFGGCKNLFKVTMPDSITAIDSSAFYQCTSLKNLELSKNLLAIRDNTFWECNSLESITIPDRVSSIGGNAFHGCSNLTTVSILSSVIDIGIGAFGGCTSLSNINLPYGMTKIESGTFSGCSSLPTIQIPSDVEYIGAMAFENCSSLYEIDIPSDVSQIGYSAFSGCTSLTNVILPNSITTIDSRTFADCSNLSDIIIPDSVTTIGHRAFWRCHSLSNLTVPVSVTNIAQEAFYDCSNLNTIAITDSIISIGYGAFEYCNKLSDVYYSGSEEQWNKVAIDEHNDCLINATIHYNSTGPEQPGPDPELPSSAELTLISSKPENGAFVEQSTLEDSILELTFSTDIYENLVDGAIYIKNYDTDDIASTISYGTVSGSTLRVPDALRSLPNGKYYITIDPECIWAKDINEDGSISKFAGMAKNELVFTLGERQWNTQSKNGTFSFVSDIIGGNDMVYEYQYDESWFLKSSYEYQHDLTKMSIRAALAAYGADGTLSTDKNICELMEDLGYKHISHNYPQPSTNSIGYEIGNKTLTSEDGKEMSIIMVAIRGGGYFQEWGGNFYLGTGIDHAGFRTAANTVLTGISKYVNAPENELADRKKIWIMGYSRGAATTNLVAKSLDDGYVSGIESEDIYAFCFECPQNTRDRTHASDYKYENIVNIVNALDIVPKVAMSNWGYTRYGKTFYTPYQAGIYPVFYNKLEKRMLSAYNHLLAANTSTTANKFLPTTLLQEYTTDFLCFALAQTFIDPQFFTNTTQSTLMSAMASIMGGSDSSKEKTESLFAYLEDMFPPLRILQMSAIGSNIAYAHYGELCLSWIDSLEGEWEYSNSKYRRIFVNCPVDVEIYDASNMLVGQVVDDVVQDIDYSVPIIVDDNGQKIIALSNDMEYTLKLTATGEGEVTYTATEYDMDTASIEKVVSYYQVEVATGDILVGTAENLDEIPAASYSLLLNDAKPLIPSVNQTGGDVEKYDVSITVTGNGSVFGNGKYVNGEFAEIIAVADSGEQFQGWYEGNTLISADVKHKLLVNKDISLTAKFTEALNSPNIPIAPDPSHPSIGDISGSSNPSSTVASPAYSITIQPVTNGKVTATTTSAISGTIATLTIVPDSGYKLASLTVIDSKGNSLKLTDKGDGKYTFTMPDSAVTVDAVFKPIEELPAPSTESDWVNPFTDVAVTAWYYDAVKFVSKNGLMNGIGSTTFAPDANLTRAQFAQILYNKEGKPAVNSASVFTDVAAGDWYAPAVTWAAINNIVGGYGNGQFGPDDNITREQLAVMLWRYAGEPAASADLAFSDADQISGFAQVAIHWAVENKILNGKGNNILDPKGFATRAEVAQMLKNYLE